MKTLSLDILYHDNHCLAVTKPARLLTVSDQTGDRTLLDLAKAYVKEKYQKPGNVYLGVVHRLDRPVSGVVLFARTSKAAGRLSAQFRNGQIEKRYVAVLEGAEAKRSEQSVLVDWLKKDPHTNMVRVVSSQTPEAQKCVLQYRVIGSGGGYRLCEIVPQTGRSHQIRVQLASRGEPIVGDRKYNARRGLGGKIALHAASLHFKHPTREEMILVTSPTPFYFNEILGRR